MRMAWRRFCSDRMWFCFFSASVKRGRSVLEPEPLPANGEERELLAEDIFVIE